MSPAKKQTVPIAVLKFDRSKVKGLSPQGRSKAAPLAPTMQIKDAPLELFESSIKEVSESLDASFKELTTKDYSGLALDEVEVSLEVTAEGKVGILGNGASASGTASLKLTFRRK